MDFKPSVDITLDSFVCDIACPILSKESIQMRYSIFNSINRSPAVALIVKIQLIYKIAAKLPTEENFNLKSQLRYRSPTGCPYVRQFAGGSQHEA